MNANSLKLDISRFSKSNNYKESEDYTTTPIYVSDPVTYKHKYVHNESIWFNRKVKINPCGTKVKLRSSSAKPVKDKEFLCTNFKASDPSLN